MFLEQNNALVVDGKRSIDDATLTALTIMIEKSRPEEEEMVIKVVANCVS